MVHQIQGVAIGGLNYIYNGTDPGLSYYRWMRFGSRSSSVGSAPAKDEPGHKTT